MRAMLAAVAMTAAMAAQAQVCDVLYVVDVNTSDGHDVTTATGNQYGVPVADLDDNSKKSRRVIDLASKLQDKGGPYELEFGEWRVCDGKRVKNDANSILVKGVTLKGANQINRMALKVAGEVQDRYDARGEKGHKNAWEHKHARKTQRDELGNKKP